MPLLVTVTVNRGYFGQIWTSNDRHKMLEIYVVKLEKAMYLACKVLRHENRQIKNFTLTLVT